MTAIDTIFAALDHQRIPIANEKSVQAGIATALAAAGVDHCREVPVTGGIIDFMVAATGIEVKVKGAKRAVYRQLRDYLDDPRMDGLVLVTAFAMGLPSTINDKPVRVFSLGAAWL